MYRTLISAEELRPIAGELRLLDCSFDLADTAAGERAYAAGHLPGAAYLHLDRDLSGPKHDASGRFRGRHPLPDRAALAATLGRAGIRPGLQVVAYDAQGGPYAARAWWLLRWLGHEAVALLDGGWAAWRAIGAEVETGTRTPRLSEAQAIQSQVQSGKPSMPLVDTRGVLANLDDHRLTILDARAPDRFSGETEPMDPVGGHIPGAINRPFKLNLEPDGRFKPSARLRQEFETLLGDRLDRGIVHQCGSGITACHNLFAMELAGLRGSALYPGSWSEWCSDPARPVAKGA